MQISANWNKRVQQHMNQSHPLWSLFEAQTPVGLCPLDGIQFSAQAVTDEFLQLLSSSASRIRFDQQKGKEAGYGTAQTLGCVTMLSQPVFKNTPAYKVIINPSTAGMSVEELKTWCRFMFSDLSQATYRGVDAKIDFPHVLPSDIADCIWVSYVRKAPNTCYASKGTTYLGSRNSQREVAIYDKEKEQFEKRGRVIGYRLTRVEEHFRAPQSKRMSVKKFLESMHALTAFDHVSLVDKDQHYFDVCNQYGMDSGLSVQEALKSLSSYNRRKVLLVLQGKGNVTCLANEFVSQLHKWLGHSSPNTKPKDASGIGNEQSIVEAKSRTQVTCACRSVLIVLPLAQLTCVYYGKVHIEDEGPHSSESLGQLRAPPIFV